MRIAGNLDVLARDEHLLGPARAAQHRGGAHLAALRDLRAVGIRRLEVDVGVRIHEVDARDRALERNLAAAVEIAEAVVSACGAGGSWELAGGLFYAMAEAVLDVGPDLDGEHALGPGAALGWYAGTPGDRWKGHAFARVVRFASGEESTRLSVGAEQRLSLGGGRALELRASWERDDGEDWLEAALAWHLYF